MSHAYLSPSSANISYRCPASVNLQFKVAKRIEMLREICEDLYHLEDGKSEQVLKLLEEDNQQAVDGTILHGIFETYVGLQAPMVPHKKELIIEMIERSELSDRTKNDEYTIDKFIDVCKYWADEVKKYDNFHTEKRVKIKGLPQYGTTDLLMTKGKLVHIADLKTGRNFVSAENNYQLMSYAVATLDELGWDNFEEVSLTIIGLKFRDTDFTLPISDLKKFKYEVMLPAFMKAYSINPEANAGEWCRYCKGKIYCDEWRKNFKKETNDMKAVSNFDNLDNEQAVDLLRLLKGAEQASKDLSTEILIRDDSSLTPIKGVRKMNGRKTQHWKDEEEAVNKLIKEHGIKEEDLYVRKLKSVKQLEKELGIEVSNDIKENHVTETVGKAYLTV